MTIPAHTPTPANEILKITDRLRGKYVLSVNDGGGLLDGKDTFTREFPTVPIQMKAAEIIDELIYCVEEAIAGFEWMVNEGYQADEADNEKLAKWKAALAKAGAA